MSVNTSRLADLPGLVRAGALCGAFLLLAPLPGIAAPPLRMTFDGDAVVVRDLEPGAEVVFSTISRSSAGFAPRTERYDLRLVDEDGDGEVRIVLEHAITRKFLAVAVELASGRFDVLTPEGSPRREIALPVNSLLEGPGNRLDRLEDSRSYIELLLVRPGLGAWRLTTGDGAASDESPAGDGLVRTSLASMSSIGESGSPPDEYAQDDFLLRVAPREMEYFAVRISR